MAKRRYRWLQEMEMARLLLDWNAAAAKEHGRTSLQAASEGHLEVVQLLLG
jgi:hypothetical protein